MSLLQRLFGGDRQETWLPRQEPRLAPIRAEITEARDLEEVLRQVWVGGPSAAGVPVSQQAVEGLAPAASCIRVLSNAVAMLPLHLYRKRDGRRLPATDLPAYRLLKLAPTAWQTSFDWRRLLQRDILMRGNAYALKVGSGRALQALYRLHPDRVEPKQDDATMAVTYKITRPGRPTIELPASAILHLRGPSDDGLVGKTPVAVHRDTFGDAIALRRHGSSFFRNGAKPGLVLKPKHKMDPESRKALREDFDELYAGVDKHHRTAVLLPDMDIATLTISNDDAQYLAAMEFNRAEICGIYGVPAHMIADLSRATFNNIEHLSIDFVQNGLMPWLVMWEQTLALALLGDEPEAYFKFEVDALLRGTTKDRAEAYRWHRLIGSLSANEIRELEDRDPRDDEGGDGFIVEGNTRPDDGRPMPQGPAPAATPGQEAQR